MLTDKQLEKIKPNLIKFEEDRKIARYTYIGLLPEYQLYLQNNNKQLIYSKLNPQQHFLFKRILHGLKLYKKEEIENMHWDKKRRITKVWKRGQNVINCLKQWVSYKQIQPIFRIFNKSSLGREIYEMPFEYIPDYKNKMTLSELGLNYEDLVLKFMGEKLLPTNYLNVK
tara:strand:+ start:44 stop:553 length:510 start_codon:yes stop_codon:yes gene_type:complete